MPGRESSASGFAPGGELTLTSAGRSALEARGFGRRTLPRVVPEPRTPPRRVGRRADRAESHAGRLMSGGARFDRKTHDFGRDEAPERCRLMEGELWYAPRACSRLGRPLAPCFQPAARWASGLLQLSGTARGRRAADRRSGGGGSHQPPAIARRFRTTSSTRNLAGWWLGQGGGVVTSAASRPGAQLQRRGHCARAVETIFRPSAHRARIGSCDGGPPRCDQS